MRSKSYFSFLLSTMVVVALFIIAGLLVETYASSITSLIQSHNTLGKSLFVIMAALAVIFPVVSNLFLLPFGVVTWGSLTTATLSITGWWMGGLIAFFIARTYQENLLQKFPSLSHYKYIDSFIPKKHEFLTLIFLRITLPVDVLSYALGLFSKRISWKKNALTTLIGIIPFAFIFSYLGTFSLIIQISIFFFTTILLALYLVLQKQSTS